MPKLKAGNQHLWKVKRITDPRFPGIVMRISELKHDGVLYYIYKGMMRSLKCTRKDLGRTAKQQRAKAEALALDQIARIANGGSSHSLPSIERPHSADAGSTLTFASLVDAYQARGFYGKNPAYRKSYSRRVRRVAQSIGEQRAVTSLRQSDVEQYLAMRQRNVRLTTARGDLIALKSAVRWGIRERLLSRHDDPFESIQLPREREKPRRPLADRKRYLKLKSVASTVLPALETLLDLAHSTGRRISAILGLRWRDINFEKSTIRWYAGAAGDQKKHDQTVHLPTPAREALLRWQKQCPGIAAGWVFPGKDPKGHLTRSEATRSLLRAEKKAGLCHEAGGGWHAFRRSWATERKTYPLVDVANAGGWTDTNTLLKCYQHADAATTRRVLEHTA